MEFLQGNIFAGHCEKNEDEIFYDLLTYRNICIKKIVSNGQISPLQGWYEQDEAEWVILLQGEAKIEFENSQVKNLCAGDYIFIPAGCRHKVIYTSFQPECIWLAIHIK